MKLNQQKTLSMFFTFFVIGILLLATPARAVQLNLSGLPTAASTGSLVEFSLATHIASGENIPIDHVTITIDGPSTAQVCTFDVDGTPLSGCEGLTITPDANTAQYLESTDRYGNGYNGVSDENTTFGYGYGYGHSPLQEVEMSYDVQWDTTGRSVGEYDIEYFITSTGGSASREYRLNAPESITLTNLNLSVSVDIKAPFPQANNYVFLCEADGFAPNSFDWNFGDGQTNYDRAVKDVYHTFANPGTYQVTCVANDGVNNIVGSRMVTVGTPAPTPASANLYIKAPFPIEANYVLVCNSTITNARYDWTYGDGETLKNVSNRDTWHRYAENGNYTATCTAQNATESATASLAIEVTEAVVVAPVCTSVLSDLPASCTGGLIVSDVTSGSCRTLECDGGSNTLTVKSCTKPDTATNKTSFEMYKIAQTGTGVSVCLGDTCLNPKYSGYASGALPYCS